MTIIGATLMITSNAQPIDDIKANTKHAKKKYRYMVAVLSVDPLTGDMLTYIVDSVLEDSFDTELIDFVDTSSIK